MTRKYTEQEVAKLLRPIQPSSDEELVQRFWEELHRVQEQHRTSWPVRTPDGLSLRALMGTTGWDVKTARKAFALANVKPIGTRGLRRPLPPLV